MKRQERAKLLKNAAYIACVLLACAAVALLIPRLFPEDRGEAVGEALAELYRQGQAARRATPEQLVSALEEDAGLLLEETGRTQTTAEYAVANDWAGRSDAVTLFLQDNGVTRVDIRLKRRYPKPSTEAEALADWENKHLIFSTALAAFDAAGRMDEAALTRFLALLDRCMEQETAASDTEGAVQVQFTPTPVVGAMEHTILITIKEA